MLKAWWRWRVVALGLVVLAACESPSTVDSSSVVSTTAAPFTTVSTTTTAPTSTTPSSLAFSGEDVGPLAGLSWPGGRVPVGALLHDDGTTLWSITLDGAKTALWEHPLVDPLMVAVGPDGSRVAFSVGLPVVSGEDLSSVLYVLEEDGTVRTVDAVDRYGTLESLMFVRPPTEPDTATRLYWIRFRGDMLPATGRLDTQVMVETGEGPAPVTVPVRYHEEVFDLHAYPGAATFTVTLSRHNDVPTRLEVLQNQDRFPSADDTSLLLWTDNEPRANTDIYSGVAWLTPTRYVIPVAHKFFKDDYSLRLFEWGCEYLGSDIVYQGTGIGVGYSEFPWPLLPAGPDRVLVLAAADEEALLDGLRNGTNNPSDAPWTAVDIQTGALTALGVRWERGPWTWVAPRDDGDIAFGPPDCSGWDWTYP